MMALDRGFLIDEPKVFVPWDVSEDELYELLGRHSLRRVTTGYHTLEVTILGGLKCMLGFHFRGKRGDLSELEFFRTAYPDQRASFAEFQHYFEQTFGKPSFSEMGTDGYPNHYWRVPGARIVHLIFDRFGPEEHMRIQRE